MPLGIGYTNKMAATERPQRIAVLMDIAFSHFQEEPKKGISRYAREHGWEVVFFGIGSLGPNDPDSGAREAFLDMLGPGEFDGIIAVTSSLLNAGGKDKLGKALKRLGQIPLVSIGPSIIGEASFSIDNAAGLAAIMRHLIEVHGYQRYAYISGPLSNSEANLRLQAFRAALDQAGIPHDPSQEFEGNFMPPSGQAAIAAFFDERRINPEVVVCANDLMAIGAWNGLMARGINVPHQVALTGFDDSQVSHSLSNQFTTVRQPFADLAYNAAKKLDSLIRGEKTAEAESLPGQLRVRTSCGCVHFEKRTQTRTAFQTYGPFDDIKKRFLRFAEAGFPKWEEPEIMRLWMETVNATLRSHHPVYELEEALRDMRESIMELDGPGKGQEILSTLYTSMLEECGQYVFLDYWKDEFFSNMLRVAVDQLHAQVNRSISLEASAAAFQELAQKCGAAIFIFVQCVENDLDPALAGVVFSRSPQDRLRDWRPSGTEWIPRGAGSLVANIISHDGNRFGYTLIDADIMPASVFELLRVRLNAIISDFSIMKQVWLLNAEMKAEIAARKAVEQRLTEAVAMVERLSIEDDLTGLRNRRGFLTLAEQQIKYLQRERQGFIVLFADLNGLKQINDLYGHKDGDLAIVSASEVLRLALRDSDILARRGGDEFTALVCNVKQQNFQAINQRILDYCAKKSQDLAKPWQLSMCVGHFFAEPDCGLGLEDMLEKADAELYAEKNRLKLAKLE